MQLQLEVTNVCNADCVFCPYSAMQRQKGNMDMDLFKKIIDEAATIPVIDHVTLTGLGETLLDRHLVERIKYIRKVMPAVMVDLFTNGTFLREKVTDALIDAGLSVLYVSLNAISADKRLQIMKLDDFEQVTKQIDYAIAREKAGSGMRVLVKAIVSKDLMEIGESDEFVKRWDGPHLQGGRAFLHLEGNWAGSVWQMRVKPTTPCGRALGEIMVLQDGRVSLCCFDAEGKEILGDLNHQTIREIYNGGRALFIRTAHVEGRRQEIPICAGCTAI